MTAGSTETVRHSDSLPVPHVLKGKFVEGRDVEHQGFATPGINLDDLVWPRQDLPPAYDLPIAQVIDFLEATGEALDFESNVWLQEAAAVSNRFNPLGPRIIEATYRSIPQFFSRASLEFQLDQEIGAERIDGWAPVTTPHGTVSKVRAFPPRLVHILAGNTPAVAATTITRGALTKGVHLLKLPANDLFTASAILRTMAALDPDHPVTRSFSAVYWKGGDTSVESAILRPQFFDKLVVWGGDTAVRNALKYAGPGFEIVSFDPKISMSMIGRETYESPDRIADAAERAAIDVALFNQDACAASRFIYAEGSEDEIDAFCELLIVALGKDRPFSSALAQPLPAEIRQEVDVLRTLDPIYRVWGDYAGGGLVIRSDEPVDFYPVSKTVNVVQVESLDEAVRRANVATQTVGVFPGSRMKGLRDALACHGVQRVVQLGEVARGIEGLPHDGFYPLRRFMRWIVDDTED